MNATELTAIAPQATLTAALVVMMLWVSWRRDPGPIMLLSVVSMLAAAATLGYALAVGPISVHGFVRVDGYGLLFVGLFLIAGVVTTLISRPLLATKPGDAPEYHLLLMAAMIGATTLAVADHFGAFLLGLEILSISLYGLIAWPEEGQAPLEAALKYLILSGVASTTMLFGMALIYSATGALSFEAVAVLGAFDGPSGAYLLVGNLLLLAGVAFKLSLVPFHMWTPDVYEGAPAPITGFLATVSKAAVFAVVMRYALEANVLAQPALFTAVAAAAVLSMVIGNLLALLQDNVKRLLAYSSVAHLGYLMIALLAIVTLSGDPALGVEAAAVYLVAYFVMTLAAFAVVAMVAGTPVEDASLEAFAGLFWRQPLLAATFSAALLSLAGIPLTAGFIAKFYLIAAGVDGALWVLLWALIIGSAIGIYYYLKIIFAMTRSPEAAADGDEDTDVSGGAGLSGGSLVATLLGVLIVVLGVYPAPLINLVRAAIAS